MLHTLLTLDKYGSQLAIISSSNLNKKYINMSKNLFFEN
jgi:hypothetical protein